MTVFLGYISNFLIRAIPIGITLLFGALGEIIVEKAGHLNLGIPGIMCMGGAGGCLALKLMANKGIHPVLVVVIAVLASFMSGILMGFLYGVLTVTLKSNQNVTGLVMTIFGMALANFIQYDIKWEECQYALSYFRYPFHNETSDLKYWGWMILLAILMSVIAAWIFKRTRIGLNLRSVGENPATADAAGINVTKYKYVSTCIGCGIAAMGGLFYIVNCSGSPEAYKSIEPMGWLAVALVIFTLWRPILAVIGSLIFGALYIVNSLLPTLIPSIFGGEGKITLIINDINPLLKMIPYVVTIIVLIVISIRNKKENQAPAGLGLPYFREDR